MSRGSQQPPYIGSQTYNKANSAYVSFPSKADAMIASLQLFHDVPCHIMDLILSTMSHPDFDPKQVKLRSSIDVVDVVEESKLKDRVAIVHKRPLGRDGRTEQAGFPLFVLEEVLEIIHSRRMVKIKTTFEDLHYMQLVYEYNRYSEEEWSLRKMCLVHRSWTIPSQKALGRILFINEPANGSRLLYAPSTAWKSIFGRWTTVVAFQMYCRLDDQGEYYEYYFLDDFEEDYREWFENVHRFLVSFTNLRSIWMQSYAPFFTKWANHTIGKMVLQNTHLRDVTLHAPDYAAPFILDSLAETSGNLKHLKTLDLEGARFSNATQGKPLRGTDFMSLTSLIIKCVFSSHETELEALRILSALSKPNLESLHIICSYLPDPDFEETTTRLFPPAQCATAFGRLHSLRIEGGHDTKQWLEWIGPNCSSLKVFTLDTKVLLSPIILPLIPTTIWSFTLRVSNVVWWKVEELYALMKCILEILSSGYFSELKSFSLTTPGRYSEHTVEIERDEARKQEVEKLRNQIHELEQSMKCLCQIAGIDCYLDI